jgi:hypothetical protein
MDDAYLYSSSPVCASSRGKAGRAEDVSIGGINARGIGMVVLTDVVLISRRPPWRLER